MDKGTRVVIARGRKAVGTMGTIFWVGDDRYKEGAKRFGIHGDDGETYWISADHCDETEAPPPEPADPPDKGAKVRFTVGEEETEGEVFWVGPNKQGEGTRVGIRDAEGETHWLDARRVTEVEVEGPPEWDDDNPAF